MHRLTLSLPSSLWPLVGLTLLLAGTGVAKEPKTKRPTDEERGRELYERHCEACHGAWAKGHGPATKALVHPVPDLEGKIEVDEALIQLILRGKGAMPAYEQTFDKFDAKRVLVHMAQLRQPDPSAAPTDAKPDEPAPKADTEEARAELDNAPPE